MKTYFAYSVTDVTLPKSGILLKCRCLINDLFCCQKSMTKTPFFLESTGLKPFNVLSVCLKITIIVLKYRRVKKRVLNF